MAVTITPDADLEIPGYGDRRWDLNMARNLARLEACRAIGREIDLAEARA